MFSNDLRTRGGAPSLRIAMLFGLVAALFLSISVISGCGDDSSGPDEDPTGSLTGRVTEPQSGAPIEGATVSIAPVSAKKASTTQTDSNGEYWFTDLEPGNYFVTVDASAVIVDSGNPDLGYAPTTREVNIVAGREASNDIFTPIVDESEDTPVNPGEATVLEPESIPGLRIDIPADAVTFPDGSSNNLNVVELGFNQGPTALDDGFAPTLMIRILPEGTTFDPPATISWPNRSEMGGGHRFEQFSHDGSGWVSDGGASANGESILADNETTVSEASSHFVVCDETTAEGGVLDGSESPVAGADITLLARVHPFGESMTVPLEGLGATTDAAGEFSIAGVHACRISFGAEYVSSEAYGYIEQTEPVAASESGTTDLGSWIMEMTTQTHVDVEGIVRRVDGSPASGVYVGWYDPNSPNKQPLSNITDENGAYGIEVFYDPGAIIRIQAWDESTGEHGQIEMTVPPLSESGSTVNAADIYICNDDLRDPCGEWGTWELSGSTLMITLNEMVCGQVETDAMEINVISLIEGALTIEFEENEGTVEATMVRVQGDGPTGISTGNLPGIYATPDASLIVGIYSDGSMNAWSAEGDNSFQAQWGVYELNGGSVDVDFLFSNEEGGPQAGTSMTLDWERDGDTLTLDMGQGGTEIFEACDNGPDDGGFENAWTGGSSGDLSLVFYDGEFAALSPANEQPQKWFGK